MKFFLTYEKNGIYSENIVYASDERAARAWYETILKKKVVGCREMVSPYIKPSTPVVGVPLTYTEIMEVGRT